MRSVGPSFDGWAVDEVLVPVLFLVSLVLRVLSLLEVHLRALSARLISRSCPFLIVMSFVFVSPFPPHWDEIVFVNPDCFRQTLLCLSLVNPASFLPAKMS